MLNLSEENLKALEVYLIEVPFKYSNPILQLLSKLNQEQNPQAPEAEVVETVAETEVPVVEESSEETPEAQSTDESSDEEKKA